MDLPDKDRCCHLTGFKEKCRALVTDGKCGRWMQIDGINPNTSQPISRHSCIDDLMPFLLMENSAEQRRTNKSVQKFHNEMVQLNVATLNTATQNLGPRLTSTRPDQILLERDPNTPDLFNGEHTQ